MKGSKRILVLLWFDYDCLGNGNFGTVLGLKRTKRRGYVTSMLPTVTAVDTSNKNIVLINSAKLLET